MLHIDDIAEIVRLYGSDCTKKAFLNHYNRNLLPNIKSLKQAADDGRDPKDVIMVEGARTAGTGKRQRLSLLFPTHYAFLFCQFPQVSY